MNLTAGQGDGIYIHVRVDTNVDGLFQLDTGASITFLDIGMVPKLGKPKKSVSYRDYDHKETALLYSTPSLYLADTRLMTGPTVLVPNKGLKDGDRKLLGILGMDCLGRISVFGRIASAIMGKEQMPATVTPKGF